MSLQKKKDRKMLLGVVWNCAAELKYLLTALLCLCSVVTILQFLPGTRFSLSVSDLRPCTTISGSTSPPEGFEKDQFLENGVIRRAFKPSGSAAYSFILMSAYRGGPNTFAVIGLASKPLHVYGKPSYQCQWVPNGGRDGWKDEHGGKHESLFTDGLKILPDWGYGRVYTVVVVNCTFATTRFVGGGGGGGKLLLYVTTNGSGDTNRNVTNTIEALSETSEDLSSFNRIYDAEPKYDYLYCGSSLYGNLSQQRMREWLAYHIWLFGEKSHFVIHDAGGVHPEVMEVLKPWMEKGYVTLHDIREQERFDGYYHNQFLIVNDCLHRYRYMAKWMFFFDVDEFVFVPEFPNSSLKAVTDNLSEYSQFMFEQLPMSNKLCLAEDEPEYNSKWGFEKLVYKDVQRGVRRDRKYAVQSRNVFATGVHLSVNTVGKTPRKTERRIMYFHYHGTIDQRREPCRQQVNGTSITVDGIPYTLDISMRALAGFVKRFELDTIGSKLQNTRQ